MNYGQLMASELELFSNQISFKNVGVEGQQILKNSVITINGLGGIGITVMSCLLSAGIGCIQIVDNQIITEDWLPEQTLFGTDDVGKFRTIAALEKKIGGIKSNLINLYNTKLDVNNADSLIGRTNILVETFQGPIDDKESIEYIDKKGIDVVLGFCHTKKGILGLYSENKKKEFVDLVPTIKRKRKLKYYGKPFCLGTVANFVGGLLAAKVIKLLLGISKRDSELYEIDAVNIMINKLL